MSSFLVLDLETVLDKSLPAPKLTDGEREKGKKEPFPSPPLHQVVCAGWAVLDDRYWVEEWGAMGEKGEPEVAILSRLVGVITSLDPVIVTFNGRGFDLPVVASRAYVHGIPFGWYYKTKFGARYRYSLTDTYDLMDFLADYGAAPKAGLDVWAQAAGWPGKGTTTGNDVQEMWELGAVQAICDYCMGDVCQTIAVLLRAELLRGALSEREYRRAADRLLEKAEGDVRTAALAFGCDRARFLLDETMNSREAAE
jgi:predicted PolB exonuclease-like 3'-5' exonuclease